MNLEPTPESPSEDRVVELLGELVDRWRQREGASVRLAVRDHQVVSMVMFGLLAHAVNIADAILLLHRADQHAALPALARQVIEVCTTAVWVELGGWTAAEALMAEHSRQQLNELDEFIKIGMTGGEVARKRVDADLKWLLAHRGGRYFQQRCDEIEGGAMIYALYRAASEHSHATTAVVDGYLDEPLTGSSAPAALRQEPRWETEQWLTAVLVMLVHASLAFDRLDTDHLGRAWLRGVAKELHVSLRVQHSAHGLVAHRERGRAARARRRSGKQRPVVER